MWSLAGNQAVVQPFQQLCAWDASKRLCAWNVGSQRIQWLCAWEGDPAALGLSLWASWTDLGQNHAALGSEVLGLWVEQLASAPDALPPEVSGVGAPPGFLEWAPSLLICVRPTGPQVSTGALELLIPRLQSRGGGGRGARGQGCCREFSN